MRSGRCLMLLPLILALPGSSKAQESTAAIQVPGSVTARIARLRGIDQSCPPPTERRGSKCVLSHDVVLSNALQLSSFTHLNCQGHRLTPVIPGQLGDVSSRSLPEVALLLFDAHGVKVQNCNIDGFDFGVLALKSKVSEEERDEPGALARLRNRILDNTISARFAAISLLSADNTEIEGNRITFTTRGGRGILVQLDSDINSIKDNVIIGDLTPGVGGAVKLPGPSGDSNPVRTRGAAVLCAQLESDDPTLFNAVIDGALFQLPAMNSPAPDRDFTEDNIVEGNSVHFPQVPDDGVVLAIPQRTIVRGNTVRNAEVSIRDGAQVGPRQFPGTCTLDWSRLCLSNADCNIPGIDPTSKGVCALPSVQSVEWPARDLQIEANTIVGPFGSGIDLFGQDATVRSNVIVGPLRSGSPPGSAAIALLGKFSIEGATISRNRVSGVSVALALIAGFQGVFPSAFGAALSLNDFTDYTIAVLTSDDYAFPSELSVQGRGNYWGSSSCPGFDPNAVRRLNGTVNPNVVDSHPYAVPVSRTDDDALPAPCQ
jgi:hypothetical protein